MKNSNIRNGPFSDSFFKKAVLGGFFSVILSAIFGIIIYGAIFFVLCCVAYFFLASAGIVPPLDYVPFVPYI